MNSCFKTISILLLLLLLSGCMVDQNVGITRTKEGNGLYVYNTRPKVNTVRVELKISGDTVDIKVIQRPVILWNWGLGVKDVAYDDLKIILKPNIRHLKFGGRVYLFSELDTMTDLYATNYFNHLLQINMRGRESFILK